MTPTSKPVEKQLVVRCWRCGTVIAGCTVTTDAERAPRLLLDPHLSPGSREMCRPPVTLDYLDDALVVLERWRRAGIDPLVHLWEREVAAVREIVARSAN